MTVRVSEGPLRTRRITLHHLRTDAAKTAPKNVLLLGGSNCDLRLKRAFLNTPLATECNLVTYEPRGIGRSDQPEGAWTMQDYAADALSVLDALGWEDTVVVGESFGGMTALHLALAAPERVRKLVISSATAGGPDYASYDIAEFLALSREDAARAALRLQDTRNIEFEAQDPAAFAQRLAARVDFERAFAAPSVLSGGYARLLEARRGHECTETVHQITAPTLVIAGRYDKQARPDCQHALANALSNGEFRQYHAGHGVLFGAPEATQAAVAFVTENQGESV